jgi:hypothetical protein
MWLLTCEQLPGKALSLFRDWSLQLQPALKKLVVLACAVDQLLPDWPNVQVGIM